MGRKKNGASLISANLLNLLARLGRLERSTYGLEVHGQTGKQGKTG